MTHLLQPLLAMHRLFNGGLALAAFAMLAATALSPSTAYAQVVFDDFDDGDVSDVFVFSQNNAGIGVGTTDGADGSENTALSTGILPADAGSFAGIVITGGETTSTDVSGTSYLTFFIRPTVLEASNTPLTLEINLQEDADGNGAYTGATEDEYQALYALEPGSGYTLVQIPVGSFADDNSFNVGADDGFDFSQLFQIVIAIGGPQGPEFTFAIDDIIFRDSPFELSEPAVEFDFFDDGDVSDVSTFSETTMGIGVGPTDGVDGDENTALSVGINPAEVGGFAGFVVPGGEGTSDVSDAVYLQFFFRPTTVQAGNLPLTLEINLHEDVNGNGTYEGDTEDEYQAVYRIEAGGDYTEVIIPIASFGDDNAVFPGADDGFDYSNLLEIVVAFGGLGGPEFAIALDDIGFVNSANFVSNEPSDLASPSRYAVSAAYPNPFVDQSRFSVTLDRTESVRVEVFDLLGRRLEVLHEGPLAAQTSHTFALDGQDWVSGVYLYRVTGETFTETRRVVLTK